MLGTNYVGIDMGSGIIKLAYKNNVYETNTPKYSVEKGAVTNASKIANVIKPLVTDKKMDGKQTVIVYNGPSVFTKVLRIPLMDNKEIQNYLKLEAESFVPFPIKDGVVDYLVLKKDKTTMEILAIAIKYDLLIPYIDVVKKAGLTPVAIEIPATAIARVLFETKEEGLQLLVDVGSTTTDIHIYQNSTFIFSRSIYIGGEEFDDVLSASVGIKQEEARKMINENLYEPMIFQGLLLDIQKELIRSVDYFKYRFGNQDTISFTKVYLIGGNCHIKGLSEIVQEVTATQPSYADSIKKADDVNSRNIIVKGLERWRESS